MLLLAPLCWRICESVRGAPNPAFVALKVFKDFCACCCNTPDCQHIHCDPRRGCCHCLCLSVEAPGEIPAVVRSLFHSLRNCADCQKFCLSPRLWSTAGYRTFT